ncbi:hypothetical protein [Egicoccus sp. AB-alg2]|uniref:hypothetical protein n=1 Tax=Egicoccus sp. AB-alg2 TaxID=3242693 RepID=UPI00359DF1AB
MTRWRRVDVGGHGLLHATLRSRPGSRGPRAAEALIGVLEAALAEGGLAPSAVVRTRLRARTTAERDAASAVRARRLTGPKRAASSSYVAPASLPRDTAVALDVVAVAGSVCKHIEEYEPVRTPARYVAVDGVLAFSGITSVASTLRAQVDEILAQATETLRHATVDTRHLLDVRWYLGEQDPVAELLHALSPWLTGPGQPQVHRVTGFSAAAKRVELELTAFRIG